MSEKSIPFSYNIGQWQSYKAFIDEELEKVGIAYEEAKQRAELAKERGNILDESLDICNIKGIRCRKMDGTYTYYTKYSQFNKLSDNVKELYMQTKTLYKEGNIEALRAFPSFTHIFQEDERMSFLPYYMILDHNVHDLLYIKSGVNIEYNVAIEYVNDLFAGKYDERIFGLLDESESPIIQSLLRTHKNTMDDIYSGIGPAKNKVLCSLNQAFRAIEGEPNQLYHTIASVFWHDGEVLTCGVYDPIYYNRNQYKNYFFAVIAFYINMKLIAKLKGMDVRVINLSNYCVEGKDNTIHCPQYKINAEFCAAYSTYFLFRYILRDCPRDDAGLRLAVRDAYVVEPEILERGSSIPNNQFRVAIISFIMTMLLLCYNNPAYKSIINLEESTGPKYIYLINNSVYGDTTTVNNATKKIRIEGIYLLEKNMEEIVYDLYEKYGKNKKGGRRTRRGRRALRKSKRKTRAAKRPSSKK